MIWKVRDRIIQSNRTLLMGILNLTPDSFSDGGKFPNPSEALDHAARMVEDGADVIDLGAESTRPGAAPVSLDEELQRLLPVLQKLTQNLDIPVSVDTTKPEAAFACLSEGAHIINDVSGLKDSGPRMAEIVRDTHAGLVLMHRRGNPSTMQSRTQYNDVIEDVLKELRESVDLAVKAEVQTSQLVVDPGLGFAKTLQQNLEILAGIERFHSLGLPVLIGPSRKSFIGQITGRDVHDREFGTAAAVSHAVMKQVQIIRVHNVRAMRDVVLSAEAIREVQGVTYVGTF